MTNEKPRYGSSLLAALARVDGFVLAAIGLGAALTAVLAISYEMRALGIPQSRGAGFPLDDAWIHAQFALNVADGHVLQYNPGEPSSGSTSPLWSIIEGVGLRAGHDVVQTAHALGVLFSMLAVAMAVLVARRLGLPGWCCLAVPVLCATQWRLAWASISGMEVPLAAFLVLLWGWVYVGERTGERVAWRSGLVAGLLFWGRPEGLAAIAVMALDQAILLVWQRELPMRARARRVAGLAAAWAVVAVPLLAYNASVGPGPLPRTFYAKRQVQTLERGWSQLFQFVVDLAGEKVSFRALFALAFAGAIRHVVDVRGRLRTAAFGLFPIAYLGGLALMRGSGDYHSRYLMPVLVPLLVLGLDTLWRAARSLRLEHAGVIVATIALAHDASPSLREGAETYALNVASVSGHVVAMGEWTARHVPRDAVIAMSDVGAISFFTENRVVDMRGLVSPYHGWDRLAELARQRRERVSYAMLFPELNARVVLSGRYTPIHAITLDANNISATDNLVVYRTPWADRRRSREVGARFDFERGTTAAWTLSGVFGRGPSRGGLAGQRDVINFGGGAWLLSSWGEQGDGELGRAISPPFVVEGDVMTLRVGGGDDPSLLGVRLWVDGEIERTAVGARSEVLVQREWDVRALRGRVARIEAHDDSTDGWGHVMLDEVRQRRVLAGTAPTLIDFQPGGPQEPAESRRRAEAAAPEPLAAASEPLTPPRP